LVVHEFVACVRDSLPYAWEVVSTVAAESARCGFAEHSTPPPSQAERGQLLRALASDAVRGGLERHFGITLAFQNCHRVAAFHPSAVDSDRYRAFVSPRPTAQPESRTAQLLTAACDTRPATVGVVSVEDHGATLRGYRCCGAGDRPGGVAMPEVGHS
jgi:hypothetical protein